MAIVHLALANVSARGDTGASLPIPDPVPDASETLTSNGVNQVSAISAAASSDAWVITASGGNVYVAIGAAPAATGAKRWLILNGETRSFRALAGDKVAIVDAS